MITDPRLLEYIKNQLKEGATEQEITKTLLDTGWTQDEINQALLESRREQTESLILPQLQTPEIEPQTESAKIEPESSHGLLQSEASQQNPAPAITELGKLPGGLAIFSEGFSLYKKKLKILTGINLIPFLIQALLGLIALVLSPILLPVLTGLQATVLGGTILVIGLLIILIANIWSQIAILIALNEEIGIVEAYKKSWKKILSFYWLTLISSFIILGGVFLLLVPGIIIGLWFSFAAFVLAIENERGINALIKSREYVRKKWWATWWRLFVTSILSLLIFIGIAIPLGILSYFANSFGKGANMEVTTKIIMEIMGMLIGAALTPLFIAPAFVLYKHLKQLKGDVQITPTKKQKVGFTLIGIWGLIAIPVLIIIIFVSLITPLIFNNKSGSKDSLIGGITGFDEATHRALDARVKSAISQARTIITYTFEQEGNYQNFNCQNPEVSPLCDEILNNSYNNSQPSIGKSSNQNQPSVCIYAPLNENSGKTWYCADSSGKAGETDINPEETCKDGLSQVSCPAIIDSFID